jgi:glycerophosphoryl diester phosphodiesterase
MMTPAWLVARPIAHRGLHDRDAGVPENTLAAAHAAAQAGYAIECDVQDTADGEAVVFHDHALERLTGRTGAVRDRAASELERMTIGGTPERVPTLARFLDGIGGRVPLIVEIKSRFDGDDRLARRTCEVLRDYAGPVAVKSFDPDVIALVREIAPGLPRGIVAECGYEGPHWSMLDPARKRALENLHHVEETRPGFLSWRVRDLTATAPFLARKLGGLPVMAWTVRTDEERRLAAAHADQMVFEGFRPDARIAPLAARVAGLT